MKFKALILALAIAGTHGVAHAALVQQNGNLGTDTLVLDTETGLQWLVVAQSNAMSYNDLSAEMQAGGRLDGYRFASVGEVTTLWTNSGITLNADGYVPENYDPVKYLFSYFGFNRKYFNIVPEIYAWTSNSDNQGNRALGFLAVVDSDFFDIPGRTAVAIIDRPDLYQSPDDSYKPESAFAPLSGWIVRTDGGTGEVPEPAAAGLLAAGLGMMGVGLRRKAPRSSAA